MNWFTENPWPPIVMLCGIAILLLILGHQKSRLAALVLILLSVGVYFLEGFITTPAERVELTLEKIHQAFLEDDLATINSLIAEESPQLRETAKKGLELVDLDGGFRLQDVAVTIAADQKTADVHLRANGTVRLRDNSVTTHVPTRWKTRWADHNGQWLLTDVHRLDPMTGTEIGILERR